VIVYHPALKLWWPEADQRFLTNYDWLKRRSKDARLCFPFCAHGGTVVQAGGHVGVWPTILAEHFRVVLTFECDPVLYAALARNVESEKRIVSSQYALGREPGMALMQRKGSPGSSLIVSGADAKDTAFEVNMLTIDELELKRCDALILDVEGYELEALAGAEKTIERFHPFLHLEESFREQQDAWMEAHGYKFVTRMHADRLFVHTGRK
jgi:FkbM family methyltransferase